MPVGPLERAVELLSRIAQPPGAVTVAELADEAGMPLSTVYRLLAELRRHGLVAQDGHGAVSLGTRAVALGRAAEARLHERLALPAQPFMERLSRQQGETVILTAPCGLEAIVVSVVETEQRVRLTYTVFRRAPMHLGASGKVLAAYLEAPERQRLLDAVGDPALAGALAAIRARGWCETSGEIDDGVSAIAAPVLDARGRLQAGLSVAGPSERIDARGIESAAVAVCAAARGIEAALHAAAPSRPARAGRHGATPRG